MKCLEDLLEKLLMLLLLIINAARPVVGSARPESLWHEPNTRGPYFDPTMANHVMTTLGRDVELQCRIFQLNGQSVSWIRKEDLHILTLGEYSYTTDQRFKVLHEPGSHDYMLRVSKVKREDAGVYECQINTEPKQSWPVTLTVQAASAQIMGAADRFVQLDSNINLSCELRVQADPPITLAWYRSGVKLTVGSARSGISIQSERTTRGSSSYLVIARAKHSDSGNYTCQPSEGAPATVRVHVIKDDDPAAMQTGGGCRQHLSSGTCLFLLLLLMSPWAVVR